MGWCVRLLAPGLGGRRGDCRQVGLGVSQEQAHVPCLSLRAPGASPCPVAGCQGPRSKPVSCGRVSAVSPPVVCTEP